ncbi:universal stress protein [Thalassobaculum sp.]|uniref:universal stress protein n=1 Tax=Thalassobaculum sp. TaxID=2022740 RepID=UPI0032EC76D0
MKHVFLPFGLDGVERAPLEVAAHLAERFDGRAVAMFYPRPVESPLVDPMGVGIIDYADQGPDLAREADTALTAMRGRISGLGATAGRVVLNDQPLKARFGIGEHARLFDLTVVGKAEETDWRAVFETALFEGGRSVMLTPIGWTRPSGDTVGVAWNRSTETARLIGQSMPLLRAAKKVVVIEIEGWSVPGPDGAALVDYLKLHGVAAEVAMGSRSARGPGLDVLDQAEAAGVDLLVKGAYTQSRLRQMIFGGATSDIIADATMPVVFAH